MIFIFRVELEYLPSSMDSPLPRQPSSKIFCLFSFPFHAQLSVLWLRLSIFTLSFQFPPQATLSRPRAHRSEVLAHITDWLPTLLGLAGGLLRTFCISVFPYFVYFVCINAFSVASPHGRELLRRARHVPGYGEVEQPTEWFDIHARHSFRMDWLFFCCRLFMSVWVILGGT